MRKLTRRTPNTQRVSDPFRIERVELEIRGRQSATADFAHGYGEFPLRGTRGIGPWGPDTLENNPALKELYYRSQRQGRFHTSALKGQDHRSRGQGRCKPPAGPGHVPTRTAHPEGVLHLIGWREA